MADYVPIFAPGEDITLAASAAVTGGQLVAISGNNTVAPTAAANAAWLGVATQDAGIGQSTVISTQGVHELTCAATVAAGDLVMAAAAGQVTPLTGTNYAQVVGRALKGAANGAKAEIHIR